MRPASRRALLRSLADAASPRGARFWPLLPIAAVAVLLLAWYFRTAETPPPAAPAEVRSAPPLDPVLALPFGEGRAGAAPLAADAPSARVVSLRAVFQASDDRHALYRQLRDRPEADARYLAYRAARDCELLRAAGAAIEPDALSERKGERERRLAAAVGRCRGFENEPVAPEEMRRLEDEAAAAGHPAAQVAIAAAQFLQTPLAETVALLQRALASGDPLVFDEARLLLAMTRHQVEIARVVPTAALNTQGMDVRLVAADLASCRLGNPCAANGSAIAIECAGEASCLSDAEAWLLQSADLSDADRRTALALADRLLFAFNRGTAEEIVRLPQ